ncbi:hypothetical protein N7462_000388 [Penicillium macrosclerotiorum]|uniref:uncharacterized protein n=1 Tax=Penicillium macrosclerotiorum TaxID=303699 RepID=UPI00254780D6|nr:uncharacterized protein N7462_000388 [Penicillium macrosclerotiorum]KAJ5698383.1 hypothetical protein N7462_000388 [Penicillium macrosclerotiorum]
MPHNANYGVTNPNDVTIEIPLQNQPSQTQSSAEGWASSSPSPANEKDDPAAKGLAGRRRTNTGFASNYKDSQSPLDGTITRVGRFYQAFFEFSIVTRYFIYVVPIGSLIAIPIIVGATAAPQAKIGGVHIYWFFAWIEVLWVSLWVCKVFAHFVPYVFQTLCGFVSSGTRKYALILRALETPLTLTLWNVIALVTFLPIMRYGAGNNSAVTSWESSIKNILFGLLVCSLIYMAEKAIVQLISISYHRKQFDAKIQQSKRNVRLVSLLFDASRKIFPMYCREFREEDQMIFDSLFSQVTTKTTKRSSNTPLRMVQNVGQNVGRNVGRIGDKVTSAFGNVAAELTGKQVFNPNSTHSIVIQALERKRCAAALARRIWLSFVVEGRDSLYLEDIAEVLGPAHQEEAAECFQILDQDGNGDVSLEEMILTISEFGRTRKALNHSMHDVDQAIRVLDGLLMVGASVLGVLAFISFVTSGLHTIITSAASALLSVSFAFSTTAAEVLGSCVFLFVKHPFDIGDRVDVSDKPYIVERISLLYTVFRNVNDHRLTQVPNNILNSLWVDNFTRANAMHEKLTVNVAFDTSFAEIEALREEMELFVRDKENCRDFQPDINIEVLGVGDSLDKVQIRVDIRHKSNWANEVVRATRRSKFMCALILAMRKLKIRAPGTLREEKEGDDDSDQDKREPEPTFDLKPNPATAAAAAAAQLTAQTSLSPDTATSSGFATSQPSSEVIQRRVATQESEVAMMEKLNARPPVFDPARDDALYRTPTNNTSSSQSQQLTIREDGATSGSISRVLSTGHRKAGTHVPYTEEDMASIEAQPPTLPTIATNDSSTFNGAYSQNQGTSYQTTYETSNSFNQVSRGSVSAEDDSAAVYPQTDTIFLTRSSSNASRAAEESTSGERNS